MGHEQQPSPTHVVSETRNSPLRDKSADAIQFAVDRLHEAIPGLTPTHLNVLGVVGVTAASALLTLRRKDAFLRDKVLTAGSLALAVGATFLDAFDGTLARTLEAETPGSMNFETGQILDVWADQAGEKVMAFSRAAQAHKKRNRLGVALALIESVATSLPSLTRAFAEKNHAVPETGKGLFGLAGTRVGRAVLEIASTVVPEIHGVPVQELSDAIIIISSIITAADRLKIGLSKDPATLPPEIRKQAETRFRALAIFTGLSLGATIAAYHYLNRDEMSLSSLQDFVPLPEKQDDKDWYNTILSTVETYCRENALEHRVVGGTLTDLLGPQTAFEIEVENRTIRLKNHKEPSLTRGNGTIKDLDLVLFTPNYQAFLRAKEQFRYWQNQAKAQNIPFPLISVEAARHPGWPERNKLKQFVTAFEVKEDGKLYLTFGNLEQEIAPETVDGWKIVLEDKTSLTTFHPYAHALAYLLRVPSGLKPKDRKVIGTDQQGAYSKFDLISNLAAHTFKAGEQFGIDYWQIYQSWMDYTRELLLYPDLPTRIKGGITGFYWRTVGERISQVDSIVSFLSNKFSG